MKGFHLKVDYLSWNRVKLRFLMYLKWKSKKARLLESFQSAVRESLEDLMLSSAHEVGYRRCFVRSRR